jgi:hypothetical protein
MIWRLVDIRHALIGHFFEYRREQVVPGELWSIRSGKGGAYPILLQCRIIDLMRVEIPVMKDVVQSSRNCVLEIRFESLILVRSLASLIRFPY